VRNLLDEPDTGRRETVRLAHAMAIRGDGFVELCDRQWCC
jgi:hypothetical protein